MSLYSENRQRNNCLRAFVLATCFVFPAGLVNALGLGEITVKSTLNQPMDGNIKLTNLGSYDADDIRVRMASLADFERSGVDMTLFLSELKFETVQATNGSATIKVSSKAPVQEPYLNFVVEAYWPDGRVLREYTVLLDLPLYSAATIDSENFNQAKSTATVKKTEPTPSRFNPGMSGNRYTVGSADTLWGIARQVTPSGATIQQTMIAIQRDNPDAFRNANINQLRHGAVLDLPAAQEVAALDGQTAIKEVKQQNQSWKSQSLTKVPLDASKPVDYSADAGSNTGGKLSLASGGTSSAASIGDRPSSKVSADLVATKELLDEQSRENVTLQSRMVELQEQMGTLQTLIELKDNQIAQLQNVDSNVPDSTQNIASNDVAVTVAGELESEASAITEVEPVAEPKSVKKKPVVTLPPEEASLVDMLMENLAYILVGLLIILLGVYFFVKRRASAKADVEVDDVQEAYADDDSEWNDFDTQVDHAAEVDESPIIAKAQALIDDGNTVKALSVLEAAVGKEPHRSDIRLKHLEVLADNNMGKQFKTHYMGLKAIGSDDDIAVANEILANTPGTDDWVAEAKDESVLAAENFPVIDHDIDIDDDEEVGFDGTGDLDIDDIEDLDMASISSGNADHDDDLELEDFDAEMDEGSNAISGLDEDLDDDFSADLLATREGGEGDADLLDLDELLGSDELNDSDEELSLDDDFSLADGDLDLDDDSAGPLEGFELDSIAAEELDEDIGLDEDFDFSLDDDDDLDDFGDKAEEDDDIGTRIELAKAYVELGDEDGAKEILTEVVTQGTDEQKAEAQSLLEGL
jgi:pilus assembly protein FimV